MAFDAERDDDYGLGAARHADLVVILTTALLVILSTFVGQLVRDPTQGFDAFPAAGATIIGQR